MGNKESGRIHHIDAMRAFAILMMLQGHFIYELLGESFRTNSAGWYVIWKFCRGFTAPIFFTVTGVVLVYLLLRNRDPAYQKKRWDKGIRRGFYLIFWGYLLRINLWSWVTGSINSSFWLIDVLHCIGLAMLTILFLFWVLKSWAISFFAMSCLGLGLLIFLLEPMTSTWQLPLAPWSVQPYFDGNLGSTFRPLPWIGYSLIGGAIGYLYAYYYRSDTYRQSILGIGLMILGGLFTFYSADFLMTLFYQLDCHICKQVAYNNYLFARLGHVFMIMSLFIMGERGLRKWVLLNKLGQQTLNIYIAHYVLLYGSWLGLGLTFLIPATLNPHWAMMGALIFLVVSSYIGLNIPKWKETAIGWFENPKSVDLRDANLTDALTPGK